MPDGLLLLHAFPLDSAMWEPQVAELDQWVETVRPDFPGFGNAFDAPYPHTIDGAADFAAETLSRAGLEGAVVCGLGLGGYVAMAFWRRHRERALGFVFANARADPDDDEERERALANAIRLRIEGNGFFANDPPPLLSPRASGELLTFVKNEVARQPPDSLADALEAMALRPDFTPELEGITVKALVVAGEFDTLVPSDAAQAMADAIPGGRLETIKRAGHLSSLEEPDQFNAVLREHLVRCRLIREGLPHKARTGPPT